MLGVDILGLALRARIERLTPYSRDFADKINVEIPHPAWLELRGYGHI